MSLKNHLYSGMVKLVGVFLPVPNSRNDDIVGLRTHRTKEEKARIVMEVLSSSSTISR